MPDPKNRTFDSTIGLTPGLRMKIQDPGRKGDRRIRGVSTQSAQVDSQEIRADLLNRLIEAIKSI